MSNTLKRALEGLAAIGALSPGPAADGKPRLAVDPAQPARRQEYHRRADEALRQLGALHGLGEALRWLERAEPARHGWVLNALPGHLDMLWEAGASLNVFQDALDAWVAAHRQAVRDCPKTPDFEQHDCGLAGDGDSAS